MDYSSLPLEDNDEDEIVKVPEKLSMYSLTGVDSFPSPDVGTRLSRPDKSVLEGLNPQQREMVIGIASFLKRKGKIPFYLVQGGGGTGKSFSIIRAIQGVKPDDIIAAAPSHFAKNVLQDFLGNGYNVITIASLLGKKITYDDNGNEILVKTYSRNPPPITQHSIIIIDEGSMVDDATANEILEYAKRGDRRLIILGDYCQLPPVGQATDSLFFNTISSELTIPMRFKGPLAIITDILRKEIIKIRHGLVPSLSVINMETNRVSCMDESGSGYFFLNSISVLLEAAIKRFKKGKDTSYIRVLAYRNKTIEKLNQQIRVGLFGENPLQFEVGELLINNGGYTVKNTAGKDVQIITNGQIFKVKSAFPIIGPYQIPCMQLSFEGETFNFPIYTVASEGEDMYTSTMKRLKGLASENPRLWKDVFSFKESFAYFNYSYATSIHKAQGSTIDHVFIMEEDIFSVKMTTTKEKLQSMYVALSRASFRAYVYNKTFKVDNSNINRDHLKLDSHE